MDIRLPVLETSRLSIRPFELDDFEAIHRILDIELEDGGRTPERLVQARREREQWLAWSVLNYSMLEWLAQPPYGDRAVVLRESGHLIGAVGYSPTLLPFEQLPSFSRALGYEPLPPDAARTRSEVGLYWAIAPDHQGKGYATEAAAALVHHAFAMLRLRRIVATTTFDNGPSIGVMRRLGMQIERNPFPDPLWLQVVGTLEAPHAG